MKSLRSKFQSLVTIATAIANRFWRKFSNISKFAIALATIGNFPFWFSIVKRNTILTRAGIEIIRGIVFLWMWQDNLPSCHTSNNSGFARARVTSASGAMPFFRWTTYSIWARDTFTKFQRTEIVECFQIFVPSPIDDTIISVHCDFFICFK